MRVLPVVGVLLVTFAVSSAQYISSGGYGKKPSYDFSTGYGSKGSKKPDYSFNTGYGSASKYGSGKPDYSFNTGYGSASKYGSNKPDYSFDTGYGSSKPDYTFDTGYGSSYDVVSRPIVTGSRPGQDNLGRPCNPNIRGSCVKRPSNLPPYDPTSGRPCNPNLPGSCVRRPEYLPDEPIGPSRPSRGYNKGKPSVVYNSGYQGNRRHYSY